MSVLPIYTYNQPVLKRRTERVELMTEELDAFIDDMHETMQNAKGIGLAANQVGVSKAITVIDISDVEEEEEFEPITLINPVIEKFSDEETEYDEGCLSLPELTGLVNRPEKVTVRYFDREMQEQLIEAEGLLARVMQHEIDHLNGIYFFERMTPVRRAKAHAMIKRIQRGLIETEYPIKPYKPATGKSKKARHS